MPKFDLASALGDMSNLNTDTEQIIKIPLDRIVPDENNFYSLDGIEELAASIELIGLQQPIRVRPTGDLWTIVSGHRRRAACVMIQDGGSDMFANGVPCIPEYGEASPAMQELRLIYANAMTRVLTASELSKQAERVTALLYELKEQGVEFPGRMREHVAQACQVSESKIARLNAIRKAHEYVVDAFDNGEINTSVAYELSKLPKEMQELYMVNRRHQRKRFDILTANDIQEFDQLRKKLIFLKCSMGNTTCMYPSQRLEYALNRLDLVEPIAACVRGRCCKSCPDLMDCEDRCVKCDPLVHEKEAAREALWQRQQEEREAAQKAKEFAKKELAETVTDLWDRISRAADASGADIRKVFAPVVECPSDLDCVEEMAADPSADTGGWILDTMDDYLIEIADGLQCSTDFLLGRTDDVELNGDLQREYLPTVRWESRSVTPPQREPLLLYQMTNAGPKYTPAVYCGGAVFRKPAAKGHQGAELTGIAQQFSQWLKFPDPWGYGDEYRVAPPAVLAMDTAPDWQLGDPPRDGLYWCKFVVNSQVMTRAARWQEDAWHFANIDADIRCLCVGWWPLPEV